MIRVGVFGAGGRMGLEVCRAVSEAGDMDLVAAVDPAHAGSPPQPESPHVRISADREALAEADAQVAVDFTVADAALENAKWCIEHGIHSVIGTTGIPQSEIEKLAELAQGSNANVLIAPNFAIGAVMMMSFARQAARWFPSAEIIELHHDGKRDAPSGTAIKTLEAILGARREPPTASSGELVESMPGARGASRDGVHIHSVRLPGLVAHQEVIFGGAGQTLVIRHDSVDRASFMPGVLLAVRRVAQLRGLTLGIESLLED